MAMGRRDVNDDVTMAPRVPWGYQQLLQSKAICLGPFEQVFLIRYRMLRVRNPPVKLSVIENE